LGGGGRGGIGSRVTCTKPQKPQKDDHFDLRENQQENERKSYA
jgi:hypothetical protein